MRIAIDTSELYEPYRTGLYVARLGLVTALLQQGDREHQFTLLHSRAPWPGNGEGLYLPHPFDEVVHRPTLIRLPLLPLRRYYPRFGSLKRLPFCALGVLGRALSGPIEIIERLSVEQELESRRCDVFLAGERTELCVRGARHFGFMHDFTPIEMPEHHTRETLSLFARKLRYIERHCEFLLAVSETTRRATIRHLGWAPERVWTVAEGCDEAMNPHNRAASQEIVRRELHLPDRPLVLCVSALEPRKNHVRLLDAFRIVSARLREENPLLVLAGPEGWQAGELKRRIVQESASGRVVWTGFLSRKMLAHLYRSAEVAVFVSLFEGFGLPVLEAMACGTPVVASSVSSMPEVAGDAAILVDPKSVDEIAQAIERLLRSPSDRAALAAAGLRRAGAIRWEHAARRTLDIFRWACGEGICPPHSDPVLASVRE